MGADLPHRRLTAGVLFAALLAGLLFSVSGPGLVYGGMVAAALVTLRRLQPPALERLASPGALLALWEQLPRQAVDAVLPDPRARRGDVTESAGALVRVVGQPPERPVPQVAANDHAFAEMCEAFDRDHAALLDARARWSWPVRPPSAWLVAVLDAAGWLLWLLPQVCLPAVFLLHGGTKVEALPLVVLLAVPVWGLGWLIGYGLLSALLGLAAWLRAGVLSARAERDRALAIRADAARRSSARTLIDQMQQRPPQPEGLPQR